MLVEPNHHLLSGQTASLTTRAPRPRWHYTVRNWKELVSDACNLPSLWFGYLRFHVFIIETIIDCEDYNLHAKFEIVKDIDYSEAKLFGEKLNFDGRRVKKFQMKLKNRKLHEFFSSLLFARPNITCASLNCSVVWSLRRWILGDPVFAGITE